jgi:hypothetical protein
LVDHSTKDLPSSHRGVGIDDRGWVVVGWVLVETLVWPVVIEVALVLGEHRGGVPLVVDQHAVGALSPDAADEAFRVAVGARSQLHRMRTIGSDVYG